MKKIILTGGGTAGHCTPNLTLIPHLNKYFDEILYIGSKNGIEKNIVKNANISYKSITCTKLKRELSIDNLKIPFKLFKGINEAKKIIKEFNPNVVFSKGGYVSLPVIVAAKKLKVPVITHESDLSIGLANKISARYCNLVLTTFPETARKIKNGKHVGPPLNQNKNIYNKLEIYKKYGLEKEKPIILVTGGSQGAKAINSCIRKILPKLLVKFNIIHLCGNNNVDKNYNYNGYIQIEYTNNIYELYAITSICISRAGSNTLFEQLNEKIPSLLIPLPKNASRGDQILNAEYFYEKGAVNTLMQEHLSEDKLYKKILQTYNKRKELIDNITKLSIKSSSQDIAIILSNYAKMHD